MNEERQVELTAATPSLLFALSRVTGSCRGGGGWIPPTICVTQYTPLALHSRFAERFDFSDHYNVQHSDQLLYVTT